MEIQDIKQLRLEKGLTQEKLARLCNLTTATVNKAENKKNIRLSTYITIISKLVSYDPTNSDSSNHRADSL